ncbi:MAG TPA: DUF4097 family beta strand repeat-containing protein [Terriglobia bacterium]|nr:DUF4097 family beta strand repeat-containing protein [Terriglobia bacterium]
MSTYRHHRGSIFWALTLITVGVLFLYQNFNPAVRPWYLIAKYWPILIIFWGLSKLIDYFHAKSHPETAPHSLFSAGEVVLLIVLLIIGSILSKTLLRPWGEWPSVMGMSDQQFAEIFFNSYTFTQRVSQDVEGSPHLLVVNRRGNVEIRGSDQKNIGAVIQETVWAENESAARKISDRLQFHFVEHSGQYELASNLDSLPSSGRTLRLDMVIRVPKSTTADVTVDDGDVNVSGLKGNQTLTTRRGDVEANNVEGVLQIHKSRGTTSVSKVDGSVEIEGRGGDIAVQNVTGSVTVEGNFTGETRFESIAQTLRYNSSRTTLNVQKLTGSLSMDVGNMAAKGVDGPFELTTRDKDIAIEGFKYNVRIVNSNGDVNLQTSTPPTHPIEVTSNKGDVTLSMPATSSFIMNALSNNGEVSCDFPGMNVSKLPGKRSISGVYGKGGPIINLLSNYGTISVLRSKPEGSSSPASTASRHRQRRDLQPEEASLPTLTSQAARVPVQE